MSARRADFLDEATIQSIASRMLDESVINITRLQGGGNNQLYCLDTDQHRFAAKHYYRRPGDHWNRLATEWKALQLLKQEGFKQVPAPIEFDDQSRLAMYEFIDGERVDCRTLAPEDIDAVVRFILQLDSLSRKIDSADFGNAAEACFTFIDLTNAVEKRIRAFRALSPDVPGYSTLIDFIEDELGPVLDSCLHKIDQLSEQCILTRFLSPSDFGFHNSIRRANGELVFIDFEYFGWDSLEKMLADFLLHPGMRLSEEQQQSFLKKIAGELDQWKAIHPVMPLVTTLCGLKWVLILLNEFNPDRMQQRISAQPEGGSPDQRRSQQLERAQQLMNKVKRMYD